MSAEAELARTNASIDMIQAATSELVEVTKGALAIADIGEKTIQRNFAEFCTSLIEKICSDLPKDDATEILCE